ncbi:MAG TPA: 50S ribosomal protein L10 [bacterium]|nr:50S ribosomal protein L10 [bacterium]
MDAQTRHHPHAHRERTTARPEKVQEVETLRAWLGSAAAAILTDYRGLNVGELAQLRSKLRETGTSYKVVKNTLLARAAQALGIEGLAPYLEGPTAVAVNPDDPVAPARVLSEFIRTMRKLEIKAAYVEGRVMTADQVKALAELPAKPQMRAMALGAVQAPLVALVGVLSAVPRNLVYALSQIQKQKEAA